MKRSIYPKSRMLLVFVFLYSVFLIAGCGEDAANGPDPDINFYVQVTVQDDQGGPLEDLRVSCWNHLALSSNAPDLIYPSIIKQPSQTVIEYDIVSECSARMFIEDLNGELVATLIDQVQQAGSYSVTWDAALDLPSSVYSCILETMDVSSEELLFRDTIFMVLWRSPDPSVTVMGYTSETGLIRTTDRRIFPNTYELPVLNATDATGLEQGIMDVSSTVHFVITDVISTEVMEFDSTVVFGENDFTVTWNPPKSGQSRIAQNGTIPESTDSFGIGKDDPILPGEWKLYQNYPNPFN